MYTANDTNTVDVVRSRTSIGALHVLTSENLRYNSKYTTKGNEVRVQHMLY